MDFPSEAPYTVDEQRHFVASDERETTNHGTRVAFILSRFAPKAVYSFYQTIAPDGEFSPTLEHTFYADQYAAVDLLEALLRDESIDGTFSRPVRDDMPSHRYLLDSVYGI
ncbi:hypothetical protein DJ68_11200 [Halorubrum sp. C3]|nr:hypothetical protein DJ68_11200 [Halorubrum sp. C3]